MTKGRENTPPAPGQSTPNPLGYSRGHFSRRWENAKTGAEMTVETDSAQGCQRVFRSKVRHLHDWKEEGKHERRLSDLVPAVEAQP